MRDYLVHYGYADTLAAFDSAAGVIPGARDDDMGQSSCVASLSLQTWATDSFDLTAKNLPSHALSFAMQMSGAVSCVAGAAWGDLKLCHSRFSDQRASKPSREPSTAGTGLPAFASRVQDFCVQRPC